MYVGDAPSVNMFAALFPHVLDGLQVQELRFGNDLCSLSAARGLMRGLEDLGEGTLPDDIAETAALHNLPWLQQLCRGARVWEAIENLRD